MTQEQHHIFPGAGTLLISPDVEAASSLATKGDDEAETNSSDPCSCLQCDFIKLALFFFGTFGNVFTLLILRHQTVHAKSYGLALTVLTLFNSLALFALALDAFDHILSSYHGTFEIYIGDVGCKIYRIFVPTMQMASHWVVVLVTVERFCAVCFPLSLGRMFTYRGSKVALSTLVVIVCASQTWRLTFDYLEMTEMNATVATIDGNKTISINVPQGCSARHMELYFIIESFINQLFLLFLFPAISIIILNTATAWHITRAGRDIRRMSGIDETAIARINKKVQQQQQPTKTSPVTGMFNKQKQKQGSDTTLVSRGSLYGASNNHKPVSATPSTATMISRRSNTGNLTKLRTRKSIALLLTLTGCFLLCMTPQLTILLYLRIYDLVYSRQDGFMAFLQVCQPLNITTVLTAMNYADNFLIFLVASEGFRKRVVGYIISYTFLHRCFRLSRLFYDEATTTAILTPGQMDLNETPTHCRVMKLGRIQEVNKANNNNNNNCQSANTPASGESLEDEVFQDCNADTPNNNDCSNNIVTTEKQVRFVTPTDSVERDDGEDDAAANNNDKRRSQSAPNLTGLSQTPPEEEDVLLLSPAPLMTMQEVVDISEEDEDEEPHENNKNAMILPIKAASPKMTKLSEASHDLLKPGLIAIMIEENSDL